MPDLPDVPHQPARSEETMHVTTSRRPSRARRLAAGAAAVLAVSALSGCGDLAPDVAAQVEGDEISVEQVDDFAVLLCSLGGLPGGEEATTKSARQQALTLLLGNELAFDLIDEEAVDPAAVRQAVAQNAAAREGVPADLRDTFDAFVEDFTVAQIGLVELGRESLQESGEAAEAELTDDVAFQEGQRLRQEYAAEADVEVADRFGAVENGAVVADPGSLSVPVSDVAVQSSQAEPPATLGELLPAAQKCS
jgi:hypothetical protein